MLLKIDVVQQKGLCILSCKFHAWTASPVTRMSSHRLFKTCQLVVCRSSSLKRYARVSDNSIKGRIQDLRTAMDAVRWLVSFGTSADAPSSALNAQRKRTGSNYVEAGLHPDD